MSGIHVAVVGAGFIGPVHVEALHRIGVKVVGILGVSDQESQVAADQLEGYVTVIVLRPVSLMSGVNRPLQATGTTASIRGMGLVAVDHRRHQAVRRRHQSLHPFEPGVEMTVQGPDVRRQHLRANSAHGIG